MPIQGFPARIAQPRRCRRCPIAIAVRPGKTFNIFLIGHVAVSRIRLSCALVQGFFGGFGTASVRRRNATACMLRDPANSRVACLIVFDLIISSSASVHRSSCAARNPRLDLTAGKVWRRLSTLAAIFVQFDLTISSSLSVHLRPLGNAASSDCTRKEVGCAGIELAKRNEGAFSPETKGRCSARKRPRGAWQSIANQGVLSVGLKTWT